MKPIHSYWSGDILQLLFARVLEVCLKPAPHLPIGIVRDTDAARRSNTFKPCSDVHAVAEYVVVFNDDVADVNADPNFYPFVLWLRRITLDHPVLNLNGTANSVDGARKFNQHSIAGAFDDASPMLCDFWLKELTPMRIKPG